MRTSPAGRSTTPALLALLFAAPALLVHPAAPAQARGEDPTLREIAPGVYVWSDLHPSGGGLMTNSLIVVTDEGVLVADGQGSPEATAAMVEGIGRLTDRPIRWVVVCSDHGDHTGGNASFPPGVTFLAHPTSRANLERQASSPDRRAGAPRVVVPTEVVSGRVVLNPGRREVHVLFDGRGHTGGDLQVYLPGEKILFMSEAFLHRVFPAMRSAYPSEWVRVLRRAEAREDVAIYVPGHGSIDSPEALREGLTRYREAVERVIAEASRLHRLGLGPDAALDSARWGDLAAWTLADSQAPVALRRVWAELEGKLEGGP